MKRGLEEYTLEELQKEVAKRHDQLCLKEEAKRQLVYETFIKQAAEMYNDGDNYKEEEGGYKSALLDTVKYDYSNPWIEEDYELSTGDESPCVYEECWYGRHMSIDGATFYYHILNKDLIVCDVCRSKVEFKIKDYMIEDLKRELKSK